MSIPEQYHFDKSGEVIRYPVLRRYFLTLLIALVALLSFGIGRLTGSPRAGVTIQYSEGANPSQGQLASAEAALEKAPQAATPAASQVYASSQGTRYYYMHCKSTVSEKNKVVFATPAEAEAAGYTLALTCKP